MSRHNQNQQQGNNHYRSPKATSRILHHIRNPPGKGEPDQEGGRHSCNGCMRPPRDRGSRQSHRSAGHHTKTSPKARVGGCEIQGLWHAPRGPEEIEDPAQRQESVGGNTQTSRVNQGGGENAEPQEGANQANRKRRGIRRVLVRTVAPRRGGLKPTHMTNRFPAGRPRAEQRVKRMKPKRQGVTNSDLANLFSHD